MRTVATHSFDHKKEPRSLISEAWEIFYGCLNSSQYKLFIIYCQNALKFRRPTAYQYHVVLLKFSCRSVALVLEDSLDAGYL